MREFRYRIDPIQTRSGTVYQPIDYVSYLRVKGDDGVWRDETLRVNHPIDVDGVSYYQASYGFAMKFDVLQNGKPAPSLAPPGLLHEGEGFPIGSGGALRAVREIRRHDRSAHGRNRCRPRVSTQPPASS